MRRNVAWPGGIIAAVAAVVMSVDLCVRRGGGAAFERVHYPVVESLKRFPGIVEHGRKRMIYGGVAIAAYGLTSLAMFGVCIRSRNTCRRQGAARTAGLRLHARAELRGSRWSHLPALLDGSGPCEVTTPGTIGALHDWTRMRRGPSLTM
jgi:hypothetical protein